MDFISVKLISASDNTSASFDYGLGNAIVENPLVDAANGFDAHSDHDHITVSVLKNKGATPVSSHFSPYPEDLDNSSGGVSAQHQKYPSRYPSAATPRHHTPQGPNQPPNRPSILQHPQKCFTFVKHYLVPKFSTFFHWVLRDGRRGRACGPGVRAVRSSGRSRDTRVDRATFHKPRHQRMAVPLIQSI